MPRLHPKIRLPLLLSGDKSISHRVCIASLFTEGDVTIAGLNGGADVGRTIAAVEALGKKVRRLPGEKGGIAHSFVFSGKSHITDCITGQNRESIDLTLDFGNSGTTARHFIPLLAALPGIKAVCSGDDSLRTRPMSRVSEPLVRLGATIKLSEKGHLPAEIAGKSLSGSLNYLLPVPSAQVESALLFSLLLVKGSHTVFNRYEGTRNHAELLLARLGADISVTHGSDGKEIRINGLEKPLAPFSLYVPADPSEALYYCAFGLLNRDIAVTLENVLLNPGRVTYATMLAEEGASLEMELRNDNDVSAAEPVGQLIASPSKDGRLQGLHIKPEQVPSLIDEIPMLAVFALGAGVPFSVKGAGELRLKESDRISAIRENIECFCDEFDETKDGFSFVPDRFRLEKTSIIRANSKGDHRIAMAMIVLGAALGKEIDIDDYECVSISAPTFIENFGLI